MMTTSLHTATRRFLAGFLITTSILIGSCEKEHPAYDTVPFIRLTDIQPTTVQEFQEKIWLTLQFQDKEGDIGSHDPNQYDLEVLDNRLLEPDYYHILPLAPEGSSLKLTGDLVIELKNTFVLGNAEQESVSYEIRLRDRAGNWSNRIQSPQITVHK